MTEDRSAHPKLARLHACAAELGRALSQANRDLPAELPAEAMRQVAANLIELEGGEAEGEQQVLVHARAKLREWRRVLRAAASPGEFEFFALERASDALFAEVDALLDEMPPARLVELSPPAGGGALVVRRDDALAAAKLKALEERVGELERGSRDARRAMIDVPRQVVALVYVERLQLNIDALLKLALTIKAELRASLVDLDWLAQLAKRVGELAGSLREGVDAAAKVTTKVAKLLADVERVRRLAERVARGGRALFRFIQQALTQRAATRDGYPDLALFRDVDAAWCPEMVVIPPGRFLMGSPEDEEGRHDDEGPPHEVRIEYRFALARHAVTFAEYDAFCEATGREKPGDEGWGRGRRPAINVSWEDATAYCAWLAERTGKPYRLPSEAEWEYAARGGTSMPFWTGETISTAQANYNGSHAYGSGEQGEFLRRTLPVDEPEFPANPFGLCHVHGNVWEWTQDCWHDDYRRAPSDGRAWVEKGSTRRVLRGGSWSNYPWRLRSAIRFGHAVNERDGACGLRVARMIAG